MAVAIAADARLAVEIEERRAHAVEHVLFHPTRGSVVSVTAQSLQEIDPEHGATMGEAVFDLALLGDKPGARLLEHLVPVGAHHVAAVFQSRCLAVWDLRDAVLYSVTEIEKQQKSVAALAASLCKDRWLFYASEGSNSIKVSAVDAKDPPKKISRKAANRSSQLTALAYNTPRRVLTAGASDGALQLWTFSEENSVGSGTKEEAAMVTPMFAAQTTQAPVIHMAFAACGQSTHLLLVGYQNRVVEVWDLAPNPTTTRHREPYRVAVLHCLPPQAMDFAKKNGELTLQMHAQAPLLVIHWHAYNGAGSSVAATEMGLIGGSSSPTPVTLSNWYEIIPAAPPTHEDGSAVLVYATNAAMPTAPFATYTSCHHHRHLLPLTVTSTLMSSAMEDCSLLALSSRFQLSLDQYFNYQDVASSVLQVSRNAEASTPQSTAFQIQRYSQATGEVEKLGDLPVWTNYQGRQLLPWRLRWNERQSALCIQLYDPGKALAKSDEDTGLTYVMLEIKAKARALGDSEDSGGSAASVTCGSPMEAMDACFCDSGGNESHPYTLLVLGPTGKSIGFQTNCHQVDQNSRILLQQPVQRIFSSPIRLSTISPHASMVGSRLLYVLTDPNDRNGSTKMQQLVLSEDDLSVPRPASLGFRTRSPEERILDVLWNSGGTSPAQTTSPDGSTYLAAVRTTQRIVTLSASEATALLSFVAEYELQDLGSPQSSLWIAQSLLFVTSGRQLRYVTPLVKPKADNEASQLLCSLPVDPSSQQRVELISACGDRLCFSIQDPCSLECKTYLRPFAVPEPLLLGFPEPSDSRLKAIFERDFLVFLSTGGQETPNPVTDRLLDVLYHDFRWTDTVARVLDALVNPSSAGTSVAASIGSGGAGSGSSGSYKRFAHLSPALVASLLLHAHKWRDAVRVFLANDPALEEYALADDELGSSSAKLPSRTGATSMHFRWLAQVLSSVGQAELAIKCLDVAGDDLGLLELLHAHGIDQSSAEGLLNALHKDWTKLNPPLAAITKAWARVPSESGVHRRHDLFSLLCCDHLEQTERRSRLMASVRPLDKHTMKATPPEQEKQPTAASSGRASILYWKRLAPEDAKDAIGGSTTPHFSTDEPKNPASYALFHASGGGSTIGISREDPKDGSGPGTSASSNDATAKMTIGPFLEDEDAVVAYWRFEEGSTATNDGAKRTLESMDTTKRENHLQILQFGPAMSFAASTAPVDKGEEGKLQEAFSLRFRAREVAPGDEWGARCAVRPGSTLDIGLVFDEDPYRRKFTFEAWIRNFVLARKQQQAQEGGDDFSSDGGSAAPLSDDATLRRLASRRGVDKATWWELGLCDGGFLFLTFGDHTLKAEEKVANAAAWQHVAFSVDITSPKHAVLKLFLQARCVASKEIHNVDANAKLVAQATKALAAMAPSDGGLPLPPSAIHLGFDLTDYEMTEVRAWANARTAEQLSDMKENYLGIAETKRRMKIAIHQRNCQCEKCLSRRTAKPQAGKAALLGAPLFPSTPPSSSVRDRRRPQPKA